MLVFKLTLINVTPLLSRGSCQVYSPIHLNPSSQVFLHFARQVVVSGYRTPNLTFNTLSTREMSPGWEFDTHWQQPAMRSGGTLGARGWDVLGCRPDMALLLRGVLHLSCWEGVKGQVGGSIPTDNNLPCEVGGHLGRGIGVYWAADLTLPSW